MARDDDYISNDDMARYMSAIGGFEPQARLLVALSGGSDSTALTVLTQRWAYPRGYSVIAVFVDHGLRCVKTDIAAAQSTCTKLGITLEIVPFSSQHNHKRSSISPQHKATQRKAAAASSQGWARDYRYHCLTQTAIKLNCMHLLVAHHAHDQAETLFMRLARKSGIRGLQAMRHLTYHQDLRLIRPLLTVPKPLLTATCTLAGLSWVDDATNTNPRYTRNRWRTVLPTLAQHGLDTLSTTQVTHNLHYDYGAIDTAVNNFLTRALSIRANGDIYLTQQHINTTHPSVIWHGLSRLLGSLAPPQHISQLVHRITVDTHAPGETWQNQDIIVTHQSRGIKIALCRKNTLSAVYNV